MTYNLKEGVGYLYVDCDTVTGMAGEPMDIIVLKIGFNPVRLEDIKHLLSPEDYKELERFIDETNDSNYNSAVSFCI